jgi:hypothetical protein
MESPPNENSGLPAAVSQTSLAATRQNDIASGSEKQVCRSTAAQRAADRFIAGLRRVARTDLVAWHKREQAIREEYQRTGSPRALKALRIHVFAVRQWLYL